MKKVAAKCKACCQSINVEATTCPHCHSSQNFMARVNNASLVLSLLATIFSLIALSAPEIKNIFFEKRSELKITVQKGTGSEIDFAIFNSGDAPTAIKNAQVQYTTSNGNVYIHVLEGDIAQVVEPNKVNYVPALSASDSELPIILSPRLKYGGNAKPPQKCSLNIIYDDFDGQEKVITTEYECIAG